MRQTLSNTPQQVVEGVSPLGISSFFARFLTSRLADRIAFLIVVGALAVASPSYA